MKKSRKKCPPCDCPDEKRASVARAPSKSKKTVAARRKLTLARAAAARARARHGRGRRIRPKASIILRRARTRRGPEKSPVYESIPQHRAVIFQARPQYLAQPAPTSLAAKRGRVMPLSSAPYTAILQVRPKLRVTGNSYRTLKTALMGVKQAGCPWLIVNNKTGKVVRRSTTSRKSGRCC